MTTLHALSLGAAICTLSASLAAADITLLGTCSIPGDATDKSGLTSVVGKEISCARLGSFGSAIEFTGKDNIYIACNDRGPGNGELPFRPRFHSFRIITNPGATPPVSVELLSTTLMSSESGDPLTGLASALSSTDQSRSARYDAEGIRLSSTGTLFISDEYGPWVDEFSMNGKRLRRLAIPSHFRVAHPDGDPVEELALNTSGRHPNNGFEGLAISPDKSTLFAMLQRPLIQDSSREPDGSVRGRFCRILQITLATGATREIVYPLDTHKHGVSELLAINDHEFLVLERDSAAAKSRGLYRIDITGATDVSSLDALPADKLPDTIKPVSKKLWLDFLDPRFALASTMPEKIEGLTFGPNLPDGRRTLIVTTDNDLIAEKPSWFWVFAVEASDLAPAAASVSAQ